MHSSLASLPVMDLLLREKPKNGVTFINGSNRLNGRLQWIFIVEIFLNAPECSIAPGHRSNLNCQLDSAT